MIIITDSKDKRIEEFTSLRETTLLSRNLALCESEKIYLKLIHNNIHIEKILCLESFATKHNLNSDNVFICERKILDSIAGFKTEFDVLVLFNRPKEFNLNQLDDKIILLNGLTSPENVGSIIRSSAAFKINSIIIDEKSCSPFLRRCIRVSMGNIFSMKTYHSQSIREDLVKLKDLGYKIISSANIPKALEIKNFDFKTKCVLIIGSEGHGIDQDILDCSDVILKIPIDESVAHLNAANAATIFLYHLSNLN